MVIKKKDKGFTLPEILLAIALFSFGISGFLVAIPMLYQFQYSSWEFTKAQILASDKMEELLGLETYIVNDEEVRSELPLCKRSWKVLKADEKTSTLQITVTWKGRNKQQEIKLSTLILQSPEQEIMPGTSTQFLNNNI